MLTVTPYAVTNPCGLPDSTRPFKFALTGVCLNSPAYARMHIPLFSYTFPYVHTGRTTSQPLARPNFPRALNLFVDVIVLPAVERLLHKMDAFRRNHSFLRTTSDVAISANAAFLLDMRTGIS